MGKRFAFFIGGCLGLGFGILMLIPTILEISDGSSNSFAFGKASVICIVVSILQIITNRDNFKEIDNKSLFATITIVWFLGCVFGSLPFYFATYPGYEIDAMSALFESVSGITTTGHTILIDIDHVSRGIILWRAMLHLFGGLGMVTLVFSIAPHLKIAGMQYFLAESMEVYEKETTRVFSFTALIISIYLTLTITCAILYFSFGMNAFDAICNAMSTTSSGGFSTHDTSFAYYHNISLEMIASVFMFISAIPFIIPVRLFIRRKLVLHSQFWFFCYAILFASIVLACAIYSAGYNIKTSIRYAVFTVTSMISSTGAESFNILNIHPVVNVILMLLVIVGGCTGSTSGGIKIFRIQVMLEIVKKQIHKILYPHAFQKTKCNDINISDAIANSTVTLIIFYIIFLWMIIFALSIFGYQFGQAFSLAITSLSNAGDPVLTNVPTLHIASPQTKVVLSFAMFTGRIEFVAIVILLMRFFKKI